MIMVIPILLEALEGMKRSVPLGLERSRTHAYTKRGRLVCGRPPHHCYNQGHCDSQGHLYKAVRRNNPGRPNVCDQEHDRQCDGGKTIGGIHAQ